MDLEAILTSLVNPLSAGNEPGQEELITSMCQINGTFPFLSSTLQEHMASIREPDNSRTQDALRLIADQFQTLIASILGFQYIFNQSWPIKCHGRCFYYICNLSEPTKDCHKATNNPDRKRKRFSNPRKRYPCSGSIAILVTPTDTEQPFITLKYQHKHVHRPPINRRIIPEIIDFIEQHKLSAPADIEEMLHKDPRFASKLDNVTSQQIYNHWMNSTSTHWKRDPVEFKSAQQHIAESQGWESIGVDIEGVSMAFTTPFFKHPIIDVGNGTYTPIKCGSYRY